MVEFLVLKGAKFENIVRLEGKKETIVTVWQLLVDKKDYLEILGWKWSISNHFRYPKIC
jgi:hypothetical protein